MAPKSSAERLDALRNLMAEKGLDAYIIPTADCHNSEYPVPFYRRRHYLSGFQGSAGTAVVTKDAALLWTDGRYFLQAEKELGSTWTLMKDGLPETPSITSWINQNAAQLKNVSADGFTFSVSAWRELTAPKKITFVETKGNLVDQVWNSEEDDYRQPPLPFKPIVHHPLELAGESVADKLKSMRESMISAKDNDPVDALVLSDTTDVAWMYNLRGTDFANCGMFLSFAMITSDTAKLYCHNDMLDADALAHLKANDIHLRPYDGLVEDLKGFCTKSRSDGTRVKYLMDPTVCIGIYNSVADPADHVVTRINPVCKAKAKKNETELKAFKDGHLYDAAALCTYLSWLERAAEDGSLWKETEYSAAKYLENARRSQPTCLDLSFPSISSIDENGAINHYQPTEHGSKTMTPGVYLIDSGGMYRGCTTDVTRTVHLGEPTPFQKECYTRVLKGHIALARAVFPSGTKGPQLDVLARQHLWSAGLSFLHGTGHGVGAQLSVHEGPCSIGSVLKGPAAETELDVGMVLSNEPGYYLDGHFGFRIENLFFVKKAEVKTAASPPCELKRLNFLQFQDLTYVPHCNKLIVKSMLTADEIAYLNDYNAKIRDLVLPRVKASSVQSWITENTKPF